MSLGFGNVKGSGGREKAPQYEYKNGENGVRLFGPILARYVYWLKSQDGKKSFPVECLDFNRETETFDKAETNYVNDFFPDAKASWAYSMMCIPEGGDEAQVFNFKKKLFGQIMANVAELGDPADLENGWTLWFTKEKTGPLPINVEYTLKTLKSDKSRGPVTEKQREIIENAKSITEIIPRATPEDQKKFLERLKNGDSEDSDSKNENIDESVEEEMKIS